MSNEESGRGAENIAVVAHARKQLDGGFPALRAALAEAGYDDPIWLVVPKSKKAPKAVRSAIKQGANLIFVWGGDGMVQRTVDVVARVNAKRGKSKQVALAILPAGTANLFATHLGIPKDVAKAVEIGLGPERQQFDVGTLNGERFAVMAGTGFDARIMGSVDGAKKEQIGRVAYFRGTVKAMQAKSVQMRISVDGTRWFKGKASCVLFGNIGTATGGLPVFPEASPQDGVLDVGVVTAKSAWEWMRVLARVAAGTQEGSPFVQMTRAKKVVVKMRRRSPYEIDGGIRPAVRKLKVRIRPGALSICVPPPAAETSQTAEKDGASSPGGRRSEEEAGSESGGQSGRNDRIDATGDDAADLQ